MNQPKSPFSTEVATPTITLNRAREFTVVGLVGIRHRCCGSLVVSVSVQAIT